MRIKVEKTEPKYSPKIVTIVLESQEEEEMLGMLTNATMRIPAVVYDGETFAMALRVGDGLITDQKHTRAVAMFNFLIELNEKLVRYEE